ncbi:amino acid adenylation enzyme/thioester reductase family protein [Actinoalloteichus hymeniacidonis]|uniref:Amino acid adenylation enzyme/thioester reductase family protein n=2 Tax=Actinoalloteichus hymeniacidonis TaxID=340345 RepID=A0AAC9HQQ3_9PSEU|nr:amino acid adenylation enzyme/thioester reductase family protein [Actinoalloteichus hymeniacidonis]
MRIGSRESALRRYWSIFPLDQRAHFHLFECRFDFKSGAVMSTLPKGVLSRQQEMVWAAQQLDPASDAYHVPIAFRLIGPVDPDALSRAWRAVLVEHPMLRVHVCEESDGTIVQQVLPPPSDDDPAGVVHVVDLSPDTDAPTLRTHADRHAAAPLAPPGRVRSRAELLRRGVDDAVLLFTFDHIAVDGPSVAVLLRSFERAYRGELDTTATADGYLRYAREQREHWATEDGVSDTAHWTALLPEGASAPGTGLGTGEPPSGPSPVVPIAVPDELDATAHRLRVSPFALLMTAYAVVLRHYLRQPDVTVVFPSVDPRHADHQPVVGLFTDNLLVHCAPADDTPLIEVVDEIQGALLDAVDYQGGAHDGLWARVRALNPPGAGARVSAALTLEHAMGADLRLPGLDVRRYKLAPSAAKNDLLAYFEVDGTTTGLLRYRADVLGEPTARRIATAIRVVLDQLCAGSRIPVGAVALADEDDLRLVSQVWNPEPDPSTVAPLHAGFLRNAAATPEAIALLAGGRRISYGELDRASAALAARLTALALAPGTPVALLLPRSAEFVTAVLGVSRAGLAFLPIDLEQPAGRRTFLLRDTGVAAAIVHGDQVPVPPGMPVLDVGETPSATVELPEVDPAAPAYVIATSGSTGLPKAVVVAHGALTNHIRWKQSAFGLTTQDRFYFKTPPVFDASLWEFLTPLTLGGSCVVAAPNTHRDPEGMLADLRDHAVTVVQFVPTLLKVVLAHGGLNACRSVRLVFCGGEPLDWQVVRAVHDQLGVPTVNLFGPTEACIDISGRVCTVDEADAAALPIGRPVTGGQCYVVGPGGQLLPPGFAGELLAGGLPLALGYLNREEHTRERFIPHPFSTDPAARVYRTGDIALWRADGELIFHGRDDDQVKVRGVRVELDGVRALVLDVDGVADAVVQVRRAPDESLMVHAVAAVPSADPERLGARILAALRARLPAVLVPTHATVVAEFPTTPSGKVDLRRLPAPRARSRVEGAAAPHGSAEETLATLWAAELGLRVEQVPRDVGFFELGGTSIGLIRLHRRLAAGPAPGLLITDLFEFPTIAAVARTIRDGLGRREERVRHA